MKVTRSPPNPTCGSPFLLTPRHWIMSVSLSTPVPLFSPLTCVRGAAPSATRLCLRDTSKSRQPSVPVRLPGSSIAHSAVVVLCLARPFLPPSLPRRAPRFSAQGDDNASPSDRDAVLPKIRKVSGLAPRRYDNSSFGVPQKSSLQSTDPSPPRNRYSNLTSLIN